MREYGQIQCSYWTAPDIKPLPDAARMLGAYLLTCQHSNGIGCYRLPLGYVREDMTWTEEKVREAFGKLVTNGFAKYCETTHFIFIPKFLYWNTIANPNAGKARLKELDLVPRKFTYYAELIESLQLYAEHLPNGWANHYANGSGNGSPNHDSSPRNNLTEQTPTLPLPIPEQERGKGSKTKRGKRGEITLREFLEQCQANREDAIPADDPIFPWAKKLALDPKMIPAIWYKFKSKYLHDENNNGKKYKSWRQTFRNAVRDDWFNVWWIDDNKAVQWSSAGKTILREMETKAADEFALNSAQGGTNGKKT